MRFKWYNLMGCVCRGKEVNIKLSCIFWTEDSFKCISVEPFHSIRAGIIQPDGSKRYIIANGNDSHVFELTMSGSYRIYIQNETTESVHVEGAYSTY